VSVVKIQLAEPFGRGITIRYEGKGERTYAVDEEGQLDVDQDDADYFLRTVEGSQEAVTAEVAPPQARRTEAAGKE
jgi:hypothetical protein